MSSSSMLIARTSQRLKALITSQSNSKKSTNHDPSPSSNPASPPTPRRTSRPHSWISHTSTRKCEVSHCEHSPTLTPTSPSPRIEPPAIPKAAKGRTKSAGCVATDRGDGENENSHGIPFSKSEGSLCIQGCVPECGGHGCGCAHGVEESDASTAHSLSRRDASNCTPTSCRDATCRLPVPRKSSRRKKAQTPSSTPVLDLFPSPPSGFTSSDRKAGTTIRRPAQLSTLNLFEALELDPNEGLRTPTQAGREDIVDAEDLTEDYSLLLSRRAWSDDVEQLIRETDKAFKAVSFALSDAKEATNDFRPVNWRPEIRSRENEKGPESPRKESMRMRGKQAVKTPLTRNASIKATKPKRKKSTKNRKMALQAFPNTNQTQSPRWTLPEVTAELFGGRMFGRLEADEMLKSEESIKQARWSRESFINEKMEEERKRESRHSQSTLDSVETREEDRSTPVEPFHLEELSLRLSNVKVAEEDTEFVTPRPSPKPLLALQERTREPEEYFNPRLSSTRVNHILPPIAPYSPISPPTPGTLAVFNATAPLSPVSAISPPANPFHDNGSTDQDPFRYGRMIFPSPPSITKPSQPIPIPQPTPHRTSRSRSVTRTSLATIREASPIDIAATHTLSQSVPATPAKNRSPIRSPPSSGASAPLNSGQGSPGSAVNSNGRGGSTLLHSALHRGFKQRSKTMPIPISQTLKASIANIEVASGSLSPRKVTPFPGSAVNAPYKIKSTTITTNGLVSTPFSLIAPLFRHGSIRLNSGNHSRSFPASGASTGFATPNMVGSEGLEAQVVPFDWTAFQMAISGGAGDYLMSGADIDKKEMEKHEEELAKEREDIYDWWRGFGFRGRDGGMGRVARSEPRKPQKEGKDGKQKQSKGEEEKKRRRAKKPEIVIAELPSDSLKRPEPVPRPWSFQPGQEVLSSSDKDTSNSGSGGETDVPASTTDIGYESEESDGPDSPMEELSEQELMAGRDVLMGSNLDHDLRGFLRWESMNTRYTVSHHELAPHPHVDRVHTI